MAKNNIFKLSEDAMRILLIVVGSVFTTLVLVFSVMATIEIQKENLAGASGYIFAIFLTMGLSRLVTFLKERTKISFLRFLILFALNVALGVLVFFAKDNHYFYSLVGGLFCLTVIISRIFKLIQKHDIRSIVLNSIIILLFALLAIALFVPYGEAFVAPILIVCFIVAISALLEVLSNAFSQLRFKVLFKIMFRTYALEIILGLLSMMVASAMIISYVEDSIPSFGDGLWYTFTVVTTIGFGDYVSTTVVGRILTVILGIYGIVIVAVLTSIIVNFYNETAGKKDSKELKEIHSEEKKRK